MAYLDITPANERTSYNLVWDTNTLAFVKMTQPTGGGAGGGTVDQGTGGISAWKVDGSAVTQPVSIASMPSTPVTGTFWQATQPVSLASAPSTPVTNAGLANLDVLLSTLTPPAAITGFALDSSLVTLNAKVPALGPAVMAASRPVTVASDQSAVPVAALVSDTTPTYAPDANAAVSLTTDGRLRVTTASESYNFAPWGSSEAWGSDDAFINGTCPLCAW